MASRLIQARDLRANTMVLSHPASKAVPPFLAVRVELQKAGSAEFVLVETLNGIRHFLADDELLVAVEG